MVRLASQEPGIIRTAARFVRYRFGNIDQRYKFERNFYRTKLRLLGSRNPLLVYTMGKVGTSTLTRSLKRHFGDHEVIQVHWLSHGELAEDDAHHLAVARRYAGTNVERRLFPFFVWRGQHVRNVVLDRRKLGSKIQVITLTRDPVARNLSSMFQNLLSRFDYDFAAHLKLKGPDKVKKDMREIFFKNYVNRTEHIKRDANPLTWFDTEMKTNLGIDVFASDFDRAAGYQIYRTPDIDMLLIRTENLNKCAEESVREFLGRDDFHLDEANVSSEKDYGEVYHQFLNELTLPVHYLDRLYGSKMARHFYTDQELSAFRHRWE